MLPTVCPGDDVIDVIVTPFHERLAVGAYATVTLVDKPSL
jgi:hypothetical protein